MTVYHYCLVTAQTVIALDQHKSVTVQTLSDTVCQRLTSVSQSETARNPDY